MEYLEEKVKEIFPHLCWEVEVGELGKNIIRLKFENIEVLLIKANDAYYWLCKKRGEGVENLAGDIRKTHSGIFQSMSRYVLGVLKLYNPV